MERQRKKNKIKKNKTFASSVHAKNKPVNNCCITNILVPEKKFN